MATIKFLRTVRLNESRAYAAGQEYDGIDDEFAEKMVNSGTAVFCGEPAVGGVPDVELPAIMSEGDAVKTVGDATPKRGRPRKSESE